MAENEFFSGSPKTMFFSGFVAGVAILAVIASIYLANLTTQNMSVPAEAEGDAVVVEDPTDVDPTPSYTDVPAVTADDHIIGSADAPVIMIEYSDVQCPFCERHHPSMLQLVEEFGDDVAWVYRHFPLSFHAEAVPGAVAAECASEQGQFWAFNDVLIANQDELGDEFYEQTATDLGLDVEAWKTCYASDKYVDEIAAEMNAGAGAGAKGTPATFINGQLVSGALPYETLKEIVEGELE